MTQPLYKHGRISPSKHTRDTSSGKAPKRQKELPPPVTEATSAAKKGKRVEFAPKLTHSYAIALDMTYSILV